MELVKLAGAVVGADFHQLLAKAQDFGGVGELGDLAEDGDDDAPKNHGKRQGAKRRGDFEGRRARLAGFEINAHAGSRCLISCLS